MVNNKNSCYEYVYILVKTHGSTAKIVYQVCIKYGKRNRNKLNNTKQTNLIL